VQSKLLLLLVFPIVIFEDDVADNNDASTTVYSASYSSVVVGGFWNVTSHRRLVIAIVAAFVLTIFSVRTTSWSSGSIIPHADADTDADAAIVSFGTNKYGGCRETGKLVPYDPKKSLYHQTVGEPIDHLDFQRTFARSSFHMGSWQNKDYFDTFDEAWQGCAIQCNYNPKCYAYTVNIWQEKHFTDYYSHCFSLYVSNSKMVSSPDFQGTVSGVCRLDENLIPSPISVPPGGSHPRNPNDPFKKTFKSQFLYVNVLLNPKVTSGKPLPMVLNSNSLFASNLNFASPGWNNGFPSPSKGILSVVFHVPCAS